MIGILSSASDFVELGRLFFRPIQYYLSDRWKWSPTNLLAWITILPSLIPHLQWWLNKDVLLQGVPLRPPTPSIQLISDASLEGWGAHLEPLGLTISGVWSPQESKLHINSRSESCQPSNLSLQTPGSESLCHVVNRQHDSGIVHSPPRRHTVEITRSRNDRSSPTLSEPEDSSSSQAHSRQIECLGGRTVQKESDSSHRMDNSAGSGQSDLPQIGTTNGRSVCDSSQQQTPSLREPSLQPINMGDRRAFVRTWSWSHRLPPTESGYRAPVTGHRECPVRAFARSGRSPGTGHRVSPGTGCSY